MIPQDVADILDILEKHIDWCVETKDTADQIAWEIYELFQKRLCKCP